MGVFNWSGIRFEVHDESNEKHNLPHVHATYQGRKISISLNEKILSGERNFKKNELRLIHKVMRKNLRMLINEWNKLNPTRPYKKALDCVNNSGQYDCSRAQFEWMIRQILRQFWFE